MHSNSNLENTDQHPAKEREPKDELEPPATSAMQMAACRKLFMRRKMHLVLGLLFVSPSGDGGSFLQHD